jgi:hypothetical protein
MTARAEAVNAIPPGTHVLKCNDSEQAGTAVNDDDSSEHRPPAGRRSRQPARRSSRVEFSLTDTEYADLHLASARACMAIGAYSAEAALAVARGVTSRADSPLREALGEFIRAAGLVRRLGVNLNQAVARLNATGQRSGDLLPYAVACLRRADRPDDAVEEIRRRLR